MTQNYKIIYSLMEGNGNYIITMKESGIVSTDKNDTQ